MTTLIEDVEECFGCGGDVDILGKYLHAPVRRAGDGYPKWSDQCPFCGRTVTDKEVNAAANEKHQDMFVGNLPGLPLVYVQRYLGHRKVFSTLNYVGGINNVIKEWLANSYHG
jgi:hypothetical protein